MRIATKLALAGAMVLAGSGAALAADVLVHPYKAENLCPAGLQPVTVGGVICCGQPNTSGPYIDRAGGHRNVHKVKRVATKRHYEPRYYTVEGEKGVRMR